MLDLRKESAPDPKSGRSINTRNITDRQLIYPAPLKPKSRIAITAPSAGVPEALHPRLDLAIRNLLDQKFEVIEGGCLRYNDRYVSAPAEARAEEMMGFLLDDSIDAIIPPWGGELAMEVLPLLDYNSICTAKPKWILGYSDISTLLCAITMKCGWATAHGANLLELIAAQTDTLTSSTLNHLKLPAGSQFTQESSECYQEDNIDFGADPELPLNLTQATEWKLLMGDTDSASFEGRIFGGCLDIMINLVGSEYFDLTKLGDDYQGQKFVLYIENVELNPPSLARALYGLQFRLPMELVSGVLIGRSTASNVDAAGLSEVDVIRSTLSNLLCPVLYDVDIGHKPPNMLLINGCTATVEYSQGRGTLIQTMN